GIRDFHVTGVQTCALPISSPPRGADEYRLFAPAAHLKVGLSALHDPRGAGGPDARARRDARLPPRYGSCMSEPRHLATKGERHKIGRAAWRGRDTTRARPG